MSGVWGSWVPCFDIGQGCSVIVEGESVLEEVYHPISRREKGCEQSGGRWYPGRH